jgi:arginyl-tRNA synthetase
MSKRAGEFITLREVMDEIGIDALRFFYLLRSHDSTLDIDIELAQEQSEKNPVYYVQYAHARICSIERTAAERGIPDARPRNDRPERADASLPKSRWSNGLPTCPTRLRWRYGTMRRIG